MDIDMDWKIVAQTALLGSASLIGTGATLYICREYEIDDVTKTVKKIGMIAADCFPVALFGIFSIGGVACTYGLAHEYFSTKGSALAYLPFISLSSFGTYAFGAITYLAGKDTFYRWSSLN